MYYEQVCVRLDSMPIRRNQVQCVSEYASPTTGNQSYVNKLGSVFLDRHSFLQLMKSCSSSGV